jgi:hypothetical protein
VHSLKLAHCSLPLEESMSKAWYRMRSSVLLILLTASAITHVFSASVFAQTKTKAKTVAKKSKKLTFSDIAFIYHGAPVDKNFHVLTLNREQMDEIVQSMIQTLGTPRPAVELPDGTLHPAKQSALDKLKFTEDLKSFSAQGGDPLFAKIALARQAADKLPPSERSVYVERLALLRQLLPTLPNVKKPAGNTQLSKMLSIEQFQANLKPLDMSAYIADCKTAGVPIPPNWPDSAWKDRGALPPEYTFASFPGTVTSEVFTYEASDGGGICYALPRKSGQGSIEALGVICQAKQSGKACFFDNLDPAGNRITGSTITMDFSKIQNGYVLGENCTTCHRGFNVYMIHPKTPLGAIASRNPLMRYSPIGQQTWDNPPAMAEQGSGACAECHEIAAPNAAYCGFLKKGANKTMPSPSAPAGWDNPNDEYKAHIDFLKTQCR